MQLPFIMPGSLGGFTGIYIYGGSGGMLIGFVITLLVTALMNGRRLAAVREYVEQRPWESLIAGILSLLVVLPLVTLFMAVLPVLKLFGLLLWGCFMAVIVVGTACFAQLIGYHLVHRHTELPWMQLTVGYFVFAFGQYIPLLGSLVSMTVLFLGCGAVIRTRFGRMSAEGV